MKEKIQSRFAYIVPDQSILFSGQGDMIMLDGFNGHVCADCFLLLQSMGVRYSLRLLSKEMQAMCFMPRKRYAVSSLGCVVSIPVQSRFSFRNYHRGGVYISMAWYLTCRCPLAIKSYVDSQLVLGQKEKIEFSQDCGDRVSWMSGKLMGLDAWRII